MRTWWPRWPRWAALALLGLLGLYAATVGWGYDPVGVDFTAVSRPPGTGGIAGTDTAGRPVWQATAAGLRISLLVAVAGSVVAVALALVAAIAAVTVRGWVDRLVVWLVDVAGTIPHLLVSLVVVALWPGQVAAMAVAIGIGHWAPLARIVRAQLSSAHTSEVVAAALALGATRWQLATRWLVPAAGAHVGIGFAVMVPHAVWHEATLSFLGVGLPPHRPSLGVQMNMAQQAVFTGAWWQLAVPAGVLVAVTVAVTTLTRSTAVTGGIQ